MLFVGLTAFAGSLRAAAEVFVTVDQLAARVAAEAQRGTAAGPAEGDWHAGVRPLVIVHVGHGRRGYDHGHIPGAVYVKGEETYATRDGLRSLLPTPEDFAAWLGGHGIGPDTDLLLYGDAAGIFPARVYAGLTMLGLDANARLLDGHLREWIARGQPVRTEASPLRAPVVLAVPLLRSGRTNYHEASSDAIVLDARSARAFDGEARVPGTDQRGHILRSINLPWRDLVPDIKRPTLVSEAERVVLEAVEKAARRGTGAERDEQRERDGLEGITVFVTDDRGNGAAVLSAILKHFGYDARFDASGLPGYVARGGTLVNPTPSSDATP